MKTLRRLLLLVLALGVLGVGTLAGTSYYYGGDDGMGCARCHEIRPMVDAWAASSHRSVKCKDCHGSSFSADLRMHAKNLSRVWLHSRGETPEQIRIRHQDVAPLVERCSACHRQERADWESGPHGTPYAALFINPEHNANQQLMDDCLRCHAMHFEGGIRDLVTPLDRKGPWTFVNEADAGLPAVPCLACHSVHRKGEPLPPRSDRGLVAGPAQEIVRPSLALYDRRALEHVGLDGLPMPAMKDGERPVKASPDRRQALCYQCHAPAGRQPGLLGRRPDADRRPRGPELPRLPREARPVDARVVRGLPPAPLQLRDRRGDDGHDLQVARQPPRRPPRGVRRLPPEGRAAAEDAGLSPARGGGLASRGGPRGCGRG